MMHRSSARLVMLGLLLASPTFAADDVDEARKGIQAGNAALMQAITAGDATAIAALYTKEAIVLPDRGEMIMSSKAGVEALWKEQFAAGVKAFNLETLNVERSGDMAFETGRFTGVIAPEGKPEAKVVGKYLVVWRREKDGAWKLHRDIWNSDPPPSEAMAPPEAP